MAIGRTNAGAGGSGGVNFKVVGGTTEPTSPKENTIWVNTSVTIPSWAFSATEPESPVEGMVWISTGTSSTVEFNALKKNAIQVYPISAKQYVDGQWVNVEAKIYQNGEWIQWSTLATYLYNNGDSCTSTGGEWTGRGMYMDSSATGSQSPTITKGSTSMKIKEASGYGGACCKANKIDLTDVTSIRIKGNVPTAVSRSDYMRLQVWSSFGSDSWSGRAASIGIGSSAGDIDKSLDVSTLSGTYYVGIYVFNGASIIVYEIELVR